MGPLPRRVARVVESTGSSVALAADEGALDERALVAGVRAGDEQAFQSLFRAFYEPVVGILLSYVKSQPVAEERAQDIFLRIWHRRAEWVVREGGGLRHYLYSAARNEAINCLKHQRVVERWAVRATRDVAVSGMGQGPSTPEEDVERDDMDRALERAVASLPERRRLAFTLRSQYHLTNAEIAAYMGVSVKAVEKTMALALAHLRETLVARR
jgi:RNA polymerase sigma-70 factor (ECF subfamily)